MNQPKSSSSPTVRLNKFIADSGLASRRKADELIQDGAVLVNGKKVFELGIQIDPQSDRVTVRGKPVKKPTQTVYLMFHKPKHVLTTMSDPEGRPTVADYFRRIPLRIFPVGRLDWDTEGLILLTNDGEFAHAINHPKTGVPKTYLAKLKGHISDEKLERLKRGVTIIGGKVAALEATRVKGESDNNDWIRISIGEGKNRQIHKMFEKVGFDVLKLQRVAIGKLKLGALPRGQYAELTAQEMIRVFENPFDEKIKKAKVKKRTSKPSIKRLARNIETQRKSRG